MKDMNWWRVGAMTIVIYFLLVQLAKCMGAIV